MDCNYRLRFVVIRKEDTITCVVVAKACVPLGGEEVVITLPVTLGKNRKRLKLVNFPFPFPYPFFTLALPHIDFVSINTIVVRVLTLLVFFQYWTRY